MSRASLPVVRFLRFVSQRADGCWEWLGRCERNGYGRFFFKGGMGWAHRAAYELFVGPIPPGLDVCHTCDNRWCVSPAHLFAGTRTENMADARAKGRTLSGERNPSAKLTTAQVLAIRNAGQQTQSELATTYRVSRRTIGMILGRERWAHVA